jgi:iron uptake system EfeUOB component EfeO/EfeM
MFKYSIRTELTRKYYERRIRTFYDFIKFMIDSSIETRFNMFAEKAKSDTQWALVHIISFMQYEKERVLKEEITAATLSNFVKSLKLYCEISEILIPWKKISGAIHPI